MRRMLAVAWYCVQFMVGHSPSGAAQEVAEGSVDTNGGVADSLMVKVVPGRRWVAGDPHVVRIVIQAGVLENEVFVQSARLHLPDELVCGERPAFVEIPARLQLDEPGSGGELRFPVPADRACRLSLGMRAGEENATLQLSFYHPVHRDTTLQRDISLTWSAGLPVVFLGSLLGILGSFLLLTVQRIRDGQPALRGPVWTELMYGPLTSLIAIFLIRELEPGLLWKPLQAFAAESFVHGIALGLLYNVIALALVQQMRGEE